MDKLEYDSLPINEQLTYVNDLLSSGESMRKISEVLKKDRQGMSDRFSREGYTFNKATKQFEGEGIQIDYKEIETQQEEPREVKNEVKITVNKTVFKIPNKKVIKTDTHSFTVTLKIPLLNKIDKLLLRKGYKTRNELIAVILEMVIDAEE